MHPAVVSRTEWGRYLHRDSSFLTSLFAGQHASKLRCRACGFTSTTHEAFLSLSVEIPSSTPHGGPPTLQDCLRSYCAEELLTKDDEWNCPKCKVTREASKRITLTRAPQHLVVHFKRFATSSSTSFFSSNSKSVAARKIRTPVDFPLHDLDLTPFMLSTTNPPPEDLPAEAATTPPFTYDAYAVVRHIGTTMQSGHYVTAARDRARGCWRMYNDKVVGDFQPADGGQREAWREEAYIVFYQRVGGNGRGGAGKI